MTIKINFSAVVTSIAGLTITGITFLDMDKIPVDASMLGPVFYPRPNEFITDIQPARVSQGGGGIALMDLEYTLHYMYLHAPIDAGVNVLAVYQGLITNIALILEKLAGFDNPDPDMAVDLMIESISSVGPVGDPSGNSYHGVEIALRIKEFIQ